LNEISVIIEPIAVLRQNTVREERSREMSRIAPLAIIAFFLLVIPAFPADGPDVSIAKDAAKTWLSLTDSGKYAESWDAASKSFKKAITKPNWVKDLESVRSPLGAVKSRNLESATFTRKLPDASDGEYVVIQYKTDFANKPAKVETVTVTRDEDGSWRVAGYFIK
jgi:hypothetical protein